MKKFKEVKKEYENIHKQLWDNHPTWGWWTGAIAMLIVAILVISAALQA